MAQINSPNIARPDDALTTLMKGLSIASQVYGIRADMAKLDDYQKKGEGEKNLSEGRYDKNQQVKLSEQFDISPTQPTSGNYQQVSDAATGSPLYLSSKKDASPLFETVTTMKNGKKGTAIVDKRVLAQTGDPSKAIVGFYESAPESKTREIETTDPNGNVVKKIVEDKPGQTFSAPPKDAKLSKPTSQTAQEIGAFDSALKMIDDLQEKYNSQASGGGSGLKSMIPGTASNLYIKNRDLAAQNVGVILEKGKLTDKDFDRYVGMLPGTFDPNNVANEKFDAFRSYIIRKREGEIGGLAQSGFDTGGYQSSEKTPAVPKKDTSGQAFAAPEQNGPSTLELLQRKAASGDKKAQQYLNSLKQGQP